MKKLNTVLLATIALLLACRFFHEMNVSAQAKVATLNGDCDGNGKRDVTDAIRFLNWLFIGGEEPVAFAQCADGACLTFEQAEILSHITIVQLPDGKGGSIKTIRISGANLQIVNGIDQPNGKNGTGNLIVGYNIMRDLGVFADPTNDRTGSHNLVVGDYQNYTGTGGMLSGYVNQVQGEYATALGGYQHYASGTASFIGGGSSCKASGAFSCIIGSYVTEALMEGSTAFGTAISSSSHPYSCVVGGRKNKSSSEFGTSVTSLDIIGEQQ